MRRRAGPVLWVGDGRTRASWEPWTYRDGIGGTGGASFSPAGLARAGDPGDDEVFDLCERSVVLVLLFKERADAFSLNHLGHNASC